MGSVTTQIAEKRTQAVADLVGQLQTDRPDVAVPVQYMIAEIVELVGPIWRAVDPFRDGLKAETDQATIAEAQRIAYLLNRAMDQFAAAKKHIQEANDRGVVVDGTKAFIKAEAEVVFIREEFLKRWPVPDESRVRRSQEQIVAGRFKVLQ